MTSRQPRRNVDDSAEDAAFRALLDHLEPPGTVRASCPDCDTGTCPEGDALRAAVREARRRR